MQEQKIAQAFHAVKQDILELKLEVESLKQNISKPVKITKKKIKRGKK